MDAHSETDMLRLTHTTGARCRVVRLLRGMTLKDVAEHIKTTQQTIQRLETGNMLLTLDWLELIADALRVSPVVLVDEDIALDFQQIKAEAERLSQPQRAWSDYVDNIMKKRTKKWLPPRGN